LNLTGTWVSPGDTRRPATSGDHGCCQGRPRHLPAHRLADRPLSTARTTSCFGKSRFVKSRFAQALVSVRPAVRPWPADRRIIEEVQR